MPETEKVEKKTRIRNSMIYIGAFGVGIAASVLVLNKRKDAPDSVVVSIPAVEDPFDGLSFDATTEQLNDIISKPGSGVAYQTNIGNFWLTNLQPAS